MMAQAEANAAAHVPYDDTPPPSSKFIKVRKQYTRLLVFKMC